MPSDGEMLRQLRELVHSAHDDMPPGLRPRSRWVMSPDWLDDLRRLDNGSNFWWEPPGGVPLLLGLPVEMRPHGASPHLEPWPYDELIQFVVTHYPDQVRRALDGSNEPHRIPVP